MKIFGPITKAVIIGGGSVASVYGTYWIANELINTGEGSDLTTYWKSVVDEAKTIGLDQISSGLTMMSQQGLKSLLDDKDKTKEVINMMKDHTKRNVVVNMAKGCSDVNTKGKDSCKDIGGTLSFLSDKLKNNTSNTGSGSGGSLAKLMKIGDVNATLNKATPEQLIQYLDVTQALDKGKKSLNSKTFGLSDGFFDVSEAFYTLFTFKKINSTPATTTKK